MDIDNSIFNNFPIEFKEINSEDFPNFEVEEKIIIEPNEEGYINDALQDNICLHDKNTIVINAGVGQGKTFTIINIIKRYYEDEDDFLIFIASPFTSLVQQYFNKVQSVGIPESEIYLYDYIGSELHIDAWHRKIQILTVNALLGNPGENAFINSVEKRNYINYLVRKCEETNRKVVIIYDEIHDAIHNFKEEFVFNLWKWRNVIHKNILLSATYNEASKVVIEYLAELTDNKIKIIESVRKRFNEKQSELHLHYTNAQHLKYDNDLLVSLVENLLIENKSIDILSYSKKLADDICNKTDEGVGMLLSNKGFEMHNCTSELDNNQRPNREQPKNRYRADKCNIGTNFKSGVSIEKDNHAFIIVLPPLGRKGTFKNKFGIFTDGINSIIQAFARQRIKGEIHVVLPPPDKFDYETLPFINNLQREYYKKIHTICQNYRSSDSNKHLIKYLSLNTQDSLLRDYYDKTLFSEINREHQHINSIDRLDKVRLEYPSYKLYKLNKSERYFVTNYKFFGKDISAYITYGAICNQFLNCKLVYINNEPPIFFKKDIIQSVLEKFFEDYIDIYYYHSLFKNVNDEYGYLEFRRELFNYKILYKENDISNYREVEKFQNKELEQQLLAFYQRKFCNATPEYKRRFYNNKSLIDIKYSRGEYFRSCIAHALEKNSTENLNTETQELVNAYIALNYFREKIIDLIKVTGRSTNYIPLSMPVSFIETEDDINHFRVIKEVLIDKDFIIKNEVFDFRRSFIRNDYNDTQKHKAFYNYLKEDFLNGQSYKVNNTELKTKVFKVLNPLELPNASKVIDLISNANIIIDNQAIQYLIIDDEGKNTCVSYEEFKSLHPDFE